MNVGKAIYYLLANHAGTSAITTRIYPEVAPQDADAPFIVYRVTSVEPDDTHDGPATLDEVRIEVVCVSASYDQAADLASNVRVALDRVYGTYNTVNVESIQFDDVSIYVRDQPRQYGQELTFIVRVKRDDVQIATGSPIEALVLNRLADVDTTGVTDGQVLTYDAATNSWLAEDGSVVAALGDLTDVTIGTPANNQVLLYNEAGPYWQNSLLSLQQLSDVTNELGDALDRQALVYDEATNQWIHDGVGQVVIPVRNPSRDDSIAVGTVLKATGAQGDRILVAPFNVGDDPKLLIGIASEVLGNTNDTKDGHAQVYGELRNINTQSYAVGTVLYAGDDGALSTTVSEHPIAIVTRQHESTGRIFIRTWIPGRSRYNSEVETLRAEMESSFANADIELMFSAQADGFGVAYSPESDSVVNSTPPEDYQVERAIFYNNTGLASYVSDSGWSTLTTNTESYAAAKARVEDYIRGGTYGKLPCTFAIVRTEESVRTGLLVDYPGAAAAYSLRLLDTDYTGSAVRVRRASDNAEQDIGFSNGDLDTTSLATFCSGTDGFVKVWYDQSGNSNDATQTNTSNQPKIYDSSTGVVTENGKPALDFANASQQYLLSGNVSFADTDLTAVAVAKAINSPAGVWALMYKFKESGILFRRQDTGSGGILFLNTLNHESGQGFSDDITGQSLHFTNHASNTFKHFLNGSEVVSAADTFNINNQPIYIGTGVPPVTTRYLTGTYQELIFWNDAHSSNRTGIESNINTYYSIY